MTATDIPSTAHASRTGDSLVDLEVGRIHRLAYVDPALYEQEIERIFEGGWIYVGHESEVPEIGDYRTTKMGREPVILVRTESGDVSILVNRCRHRGATVCQAKSGNARFFRCEYHGWTYRNTGELIGVTYNEGYDEKLDRTKLPLVPVARVESYRGFVFGSLSADVPTLVDHLAGARPYLDLFVDQAQGLPLKASVGTQQLQYSGNWKFQLENGCDGYHPNFTHRSFYRVMEAHGGHNGSYVGATAPAVSKTLGNGHVTLDQRASQGTHYIDRVKLAPDADEIIAELAEGLTEDELNRLLATSSSLAFNLTIFPNLQLIGTHIREIVPVDVGTTTVRYTPLLVEGVPNGVNRLRLRAHELFYSAAGFGVPDDGEMFQRATAGLQASDDWLIMSRGMARETKIDTGVQGHITDEVPQRGLWAEWARRMASATVGEN